MSSPLLRLDVTSRRDKPAGGLVALLWEECTDTITRLNPVDCGYPRVGSVSELLEMLAALGQIRQLADGQFISALPTRRQMELILT
jgi:hypothetical protein